MKLEKVISTSDQWQVHVSRDSYKLAQYLIYVNKNMLILFYYQKEPRIILDYKNPFAIRCSSREYQKEIGHV